MKTIPVPIARFLDHKTIAVIGVSRGGQSPANGIMKRLRETGHTVYPVNPNAETVEGERCYPDVLSLPERPGGAVIVTRPEIAAAAAGLCAEAGVRDVWLHRSIGTGSYSAEAVRECERKQIGCIAGGCPMMYCGKVDIFHACMRGIMTWRKQLPA